MELQEIERNGSDGATYIHNEQGTTSNGGGVASRIEERDHLLSGQTTSCNGEVMPSNQSTGNQRDLESTYTPPEVSSMCRIRNELNEVVCLNVRLWMVIIIIFLVIITVIIISLVLCSAIYKDPDENFDLSLFKASLYFNGSFELPNQVFAEDIFTISSNDSQALAADLKEKLTDLYVSSAALGRYFSKADVYGFRNNSGIADYQLMFVMPEEDQEQLRNFTLSREMVYNVLRQFLYDQEYDVSRPMYINPLSLKMSFSYQ